MKHRYMVLFVVVGLLLAGQVFAEGQAESQAADDQWETITVTGTVSFKDLPHPEITSGRTTYELMVPRYATYDLNVSAGDTITVEGILVDPPANDDSQYLMVTKATINGEVYEVPYGPGSMGRMGMPYGRFGGFDDDDRYPRSRMDDRFGRGRSF